MNWDFVSDNHINFWVGHDTNPEKMKKKIVEFTEKIIPNQPSRTLVIAGDMGHNNLQNFLMVSYLKEFYKTIFYVFGNHDYYLETNSMKKKYKKSKNRIIEMESMLNQLDGVYRLDGKVIEVEGIRFGGCDMWYDFLYGQKILGETEQMAYEHWWSTSRDRDYHVGMPHPTEKAKWEKEKAKNIECDVFVSHVPPIGIPFQEGYRKERDMSFYTFDASHLFLKQKPKVWVSGHIHQEMDVMINGIHHVSNPVGYPDDEDKNPIPVKIKTYSME